MGKAAPKKKPGKRRAFIFAAIMIAAIAIRAVWLSQLSASEIGGELSIDSEFYRNLASDIMGGKGLPAGALTFNPLYPFFLSAVFRLFGTGLLATRIVQSLLGLVTIAFIYLAGMRLVEGPRKGKLTGSTVSLVAIAIAVLYPQFVLYEGMLLGTTLEVLLLAASFALGLAMDQDLHGGQLLRVGSKRMPPWLGGGLLGAMCGAGALGRPNLFLPLLAGIPIWIILRNLRKRLWLAPALGFAVAAALFLLPPTIHNMRSAGEFVPVTAHGGINFYIGNRPGTYGVYQPPEDMRGEMRGLIEDARAKAEQETGRRMTDAEASDYYMDKALTSIKGDPASWLLLLGRKLVLFWNKIEVHDMPEVLYFQESLPLFKFPFLTFSLIAPLGVAGLVVLLRSGRNRSIVCLFLGTAHISILLFYINSRYRLPILPVVILLAALFIAWVAREISRKRIKPAAVMIAVALATFFLVSNRTIVQANRGSVYTFLGTYYMNAGNEAKAAEAFAEAYRLDPNRDTSMINYARVLMMRNQFQQAVQIYARAYALNPRYPRLATEFAYTLQKLGRHNDARRLALDIVASGEPSERVTACKILATIAFFEEKKKVALQWVTRGLEIAPDDSELRLMLEAVEEMP
jgi:tetratricopeptide (TPR) repeat protein